MPPALGGRDGRWTRARPPSQPGGHGARRPAEPAARGRPRMRADPSRGEDGCCAPWPPTWPSRARGLRAARPTRAGMRARAGRDRPSTTERSAGPGDERGGRAGFMRWRCARARLGGRGRRGHPVSPPSSGDLLRRGGLASFFCAPPGIRGARLCHRPVSDLKFGSGRCRLVCALQPTGHAIFRCRIAFAVRRVVTFRPEGPSSPRCGFVSTSSSLRHT